MEKKKTNKLLAYDKIFVNVGAKRRGKIISNEEIDMGEFVEKALEKRVLKLKAIVNASIEVPDFFTRLSSSRCREAICENCYTAINIMALEMKYFLRSELRKIVEEDIKK